MNPILFLRFLLQKKRIFVINFLLITLVGWFYAFIVVKKEYVAQTTFLPPQSAETSPVTALLGYTLPSLSSAGVLPEQISAIFNSNATKRSVIERFDLYRKFKLTKSKNKFVLAAKQLNKLLSMDINQTSGLGFQQTTISFSIQSYSTSPDTAKMMVDFTFSLVDSAIRSISIERASRNRTFVETQLAKSKVKLDSLDTVMQGFQKTNKAYVMPEQVKLSLSTYATIKADAMMTEIELQNLLRERQESSPEIQQLRRNLSVINQKLTSIETSETPNVLPGLNLSTRLVPIFTNLERDIEAQEQVILLLTKELEQAKLQEARNISSLVVIDPAFRPEYKDRPKRLPLIAVIVLLENVFLFLILSYQFTFSYLLKNSRGFSELVDELKPRNFSH